MCIRDSSYIARVIEPLIQITMQFSQLQQSVVATARVSALLDEAQALEHAQGRETPALRHAQTGSELPAVDIRKLTFAYVENQPVLHELSLTIPQGAFFGIVGHTGSGKSTLLSLLLRFYPVTQGSIAINGVALDSIDNEHCLLYTSPSPRDATLSRMPSSA